MRFLLLALLFSCAGAPIKPRPATHPLPPPWYIYPQCHENTPPDCDVPAKPEEL